MGAKYDRMGIRQAFISLALIMAVSVSTAFGTSIEVNVADMVNSEAKELSRTLNNNVLKVSYDVLNSGSSGYGARMRLDVFNGTGQTATLWSREEKLIPGERRTISMYWYGPQDNENITVKARLYRAYETAEVGNLTEKFGKGDAEESIELDKIRVYDDEIRFRIKSRSDTERIIVYPEEYPRGWIFEQGTVDNIEAGRLKPASIHYETGLFSEKRITLLAVSEDGRYYGRRTFELKKEQGLGKWLNKFTDWLGL